MFVAICTFAYIAVTAGRYDYHASIVAIAPALGVSKLELGSVISLFAVPYGLGQFLNAFISGRYNQRLVVFAALVLSAAANVALPFCTTVAAMRVLWFANGIVQSFVWCSMIKTLAGNVSDKAMPNAILLSSATYPIGNFVAYGLAAIGASIGCWKFAFFSSAGLLLAAAATWIAVYKRRYYEHPAQNVAKPGAHARCATGRVAAFVVLTGLVTVAAYFVKDGVNSWLPSLIHETFKMSSSASIMLTLCLPCAGVFASAANKYFYQAVPNHSVVNASALALCVVAAIAILPALSCGNAAMAVACCVAMFFGMAMIANVTTSMVPLNFRSRLDSGFVAGMMETFGYVGNAIGAAVLGGIADEHGWSAVFQVVLSVAAVATVLAVCAIAAERRIRR